MNNHPNNYLLKTGLLSVALTWSLFTFYVFTKAAISLAPMSFWPFLNDTASVIGLGFRTAASLFAVIAIFFFIFKRDLKAGNDDVREMDYSRRSYLRLLPFSLWNMGYVIF